MAEIESLYSDGACKGNPGPGGWGAVAYLADGSVAEFGGRDAATTNNRMEMQAAIEAMKFFLQTGQATPCALYTDSEYVIKGITSWIKGWKSKGWKTAAGKPVVNQDLWETLDDLSNSVRQQTQGKPLRWEYVRGHTGNVGNERCDVIASSYALGKPIALHQPASMKSGSHIKFAPAPSPMSLPLNFAKTIEDQHHGHHDGDNMPRGERVAHLHYMIETLNIAEEIAAEGYFITSAELADLMDINAGAVTSRGDHWIWRNWIVSRARKEGNQILWQLERVEFPNESTPEPIPS
jgi:ribonuclease HI